MSVVRAVIAGLDLEEEGSTVFLPLCRLALTMTRLKMQARGNDWGSSPTDRRTAAMARSRFNARRQKANREMCLVLGGDDMAEECLTGARLVRLLPEDEWDEDNIVEHRYDLRPLAEFKPVDIPSSRPEERRCKDGTSAAEKRAMDVELELRIARLESRIRKVMEGAVDQAQSYRLQLRQNKSKGKNSNNYVARKNAWLHTREQNKDVRVHAAIYNHGVKRLARLFWDDTTLAQERKVALLSRYRPIRAEDIRCTTATYDMYNNTRTKGKFQLPWFWKMGMGRDPDDMDVDEGIQAMDDETFIGNCERAQPSALC